MIERCGKKVVVDLHRNGTPDLGEPGNGPTARQIHNDFLDRPRISEAAG